MRIAASIALLLALGACERETAPSDTVKDAAETIVEQVDGSPPTPKLAQGKFAPRDECRDQPGATQFRRTLERAVEARDTDALAALAAPDVKLDFGGGSGREELRARLAQTDAGLWKELDALLALGCAVNPQGGITLPWYFAQDFGALDPMMGMIVTGETVPLLREPRRDAPRLAALSWDAVELVDDELKPEAVYREVATAEGTTGFVAADRLRSLVDYRLIASSRDGKWSFTSLIAGD